MWLGCKRDLIRSIKKIYFAVTTLSKEVRCDFLLKLEDEEAFTAEATFHLSVQDKKPKFRMRGKSKQYAVAEGTKESPINALVFYANTKSSRLSFFLFFSFLFFSLVPGD